MIGAGREYRDYRLKGPMPCNRRAVSRELITEAPGASRVRSGPLLLSAEAYMMHAIEVCDGRCGHES